MQHIKQMTNTAGWWHNNRVFSSRYARCGV